MSSPDSSHGSIANALAACFVLATFGLLLTGYPLPALGASVLAMVTATFAGIRGGSGLGLLVSIISFVVVAGWYAFHLISAIGSINC